MISRVLDLCTTAGRGGINDLAHLGCRPDNPHREKQPAYQDHKRQKEDIPSRYAVIGVELACAAYVLGIHLAVFGQ